MKRISLNEYLAILQLAFENENLDIKQHPEDIEVAVEFTNRVIFKTLDALDND
jgi:hypothetical protein